jgi:hypothetical protein
MFLTILQSLALNFLAGGTEVEIFVICSYRKFIGSKWLEVNDQHRVLGTGR